MQKYLNIALLILILVLIISTLKPGDKKLTNNTKEENSPMPSSTSQVKGAKQYSKAEQILETGKSYTAKIVTSKGDITVELSKDTPITTNNFLFLAKEGFYDNVIFHRVIKGFMIQGGDPTGTGTGGPGYRFGDEKFTGEYKRGVIAMANAGPNTNGSQFFIMHADYPLPPNYVIFGKVASGMEVVDAIATTSTNQSDRPLETISIKSIEISEK